MDMVEELIVSPQEFLLIQEKTGELYGPSLFKEDDIFGIWANAERKFIQFMTEKFGVKPYHSYKVTVDYSRQGVR